MAAIIELMRYFGAYLRKHSDILIYTYGLDHFFWGGGGGVQNLKYNIFGGLKKKTNIAWGMKKL